MVTLPGIGATFLIVKIAALDQPEYCHDEKLSKENLILEEKEHKVQKT